MAKVYPNLRKHNIEDIEFTSHLEGDVSAIKNYFKSKGFSGKNQEGQQIVLFKNYTSGKSKTVFLMFIDFHKKDKNKARLRMEFEADSQLDIKLKKIKQFKESDFLEFFKWFNENEKITKGDVILSANCLFPLTTGYQLPSPIQADSKNNMYPVGIRYGFQEKLKIETAVVEIVDHKKRPLHFMIRTLPYFKFDINYCGAIFFKGPIEFINNMAKIFCGRSEKVKKHAKT